MFICDEMRAEASPEAAAARLAALARGNSLTRASHAAWDAGIAVQAARPGSAVPCLVQVHCRGPARTDAAPLLILRWEAVAGNGQPFPALDADITLAADGDHAVLVSLAGVYRTSPGTRTDRAVARQAATVISRALLGRIVDAISDPVPVAGAGGRPAVAHGAGAR